MRWQHLSTLFGVPVALGAAVPPSNSDACQQISNAVASAKGQQQAFVSAATGLECLSSVPIDNAKGAAFVKEIRKYFELQSNVAYFKSPPKGYWYPPVDLLGQLDDLASKIAAGHFTSQYTADQALSELIFSIHDPHLTLQPCTAQVVTFARPLYLVSVSEDGIKDPLIFSLEDVVSGNARAGSHIVSIDGQDASAFIQAEALKWNMWDPDGAYNNMFWSNARDPLGPDLAATFSIPVANFDVGPTTGLTFANGTQSTIENRAVITTKYWSSEITNGQSFYEAFCAISQSPQASTTASSTAASTTSAAASATATFFGHPMKPVVADPNAMVAGYFLNDSCYQDVAVLYVNKFEPLEAFVDPDFPTTYAELAQTAAREFLAKAKEAGKKKLIVDVSGNLGGDSALAVDIFRRLFPHLLPLENPRFRMPEAGQIYVNSFFNVKPDDLIPQPSDNSTVKEGKENLSIFHWYPFSYQTIDGKNITSVSQIFSPDSAHVFNGDNMSSVLSYPWGNARYSLTEDYIIPYGYPDSPEKPASEPPFKVDDILIVSDGTCQSACNTFISSLRIEGGVKSVVFGGLPGAGSMQAACGTKGESDTSLLSIQGATEFLLGTGLIPASDAAALAEAERVLPGVDPLPLGYPEAVLGTGTLNTDDRIVPRELPANGGAGVPQQYLWEPAECHVYFTLESVADPAKMWSHAADLAWGSKSQAKCAWGSLRGKSLDFNVPHYRGDKSA